MRPMRDRLIVDRDEMFPLSEGTVSGSGSRARALQPSRVIRVCDATATNTATQPRHERIQERVRRRRLRGYTIIAHRYVSKTTETAPR
jgi:hypothetical protein